MRFKMKYGLNIQRLQVIQDYIIILFLCINFLKKFQANPSCKKICNEIFIKFDYLKTIFETNLATAKSAIGLGDTTDARATRVAETEKE